MTLRNKYWMAAACLAALSTTSAFAQDSGTTGIVRITDGRARTGVQKTAFHNEAGVAVEAAPGASYCPDCYGYGHGSCKSCQKHCNLFQERYCKNSPDHGYSPPAKYPLHRRGVQYNAYFPQQWYGTPGATYAAAPVVYQPTDTTQLGYYYQHVPYWQPNPARVPQRPIPSQWHITAPVVHASNFHGGYGGYGGYGNGLGYDCPECRMSQPVQSTTPGAPTEVQPGPTPVPHGEPNTSLPVPRQFEDSAASGHIRRIGYE